MDRGGSDAERRCALGGAVLMAATRKNAIDFLTREYLIDRLSYFPETGEWVWRESSIRSVSQNAKWTGKPAGTINSNGYLMICLEYIPIGAHRLAFLYMTGSMPSMLVDHINGIKNDNRWDNLRECTSSQNSMNAKGCRNSLSGLKGAGWSSRNGQWRATIERDGKPISLGFFDSKYEAHSAYKKKALELFGEFSNFSSRESVTGIT